MAKTELELKLREKELDFEKKLVQDELKHLQLPDEMRNEWRVQFGFPKIAQELGLRDKLNKETFEKLESEVANVIEKIIVMVPSYEHVKLPCQTCAKIKDILSK